MQIGQVPYQYIPDAPVNDTRSVTMEADTGDTLIPSLQVFAEPASVAVEPDCFFCDATRAWLAAGALAVVWWAMRKPGR